MGIPPEGGGRRQKCVLPSDHCVILGVADVPVSSLHSALKGFLDPLRSNDLRTDFFAMYRRESDEFDQDYTGKYNEDLNTSLIFVSHHVPVIHAGR